MRISFISPGTTTVGHGIRALAAYTERCGHEVQLIHITQPVIAAAYNYPESVYTDLLDLVRTSHVAAFSFVSNHLPQAARLSSFLRERLAVPVVWGGIHATGAPRRCLEWADVVCVGEGERVLEQVLESLALGKTPEGIAGTWCRDGGAGTAGPAPAPVGDVNALPVPFYDDEREFVREGDRLVRMNEERRKRCLRAPQGWYAPPGQVCYPYLTMTSRGCPNACAYCCNDLYRTLYGASHWTTRRRSTEVVMGELGSILDRMPYVNYMEFFDDDFMSQSDSEVERFASAYRENIGLPFRCCVRPDSVSRAKVAALREAGLRLVEIGLQSASPRTNRLYHRPFDPVAFRRAAAAIEQVGGVRMQYDLIVDNPFEGTVDIAQTFRFLATAPQPAIVVPFSLTFFPGTALHARAVREGLLHDAEDLVPDKRTDTTYEHVNPYVHFLLYALRKAQRYHLAPVTVIRLLTAPWLMRLSTEPVPRRFWHALLKLLRALSPSYAIARVRALARPRLSG